MKQINVQIILTHKKNKNRKLYVFQELKHVLIKLHILTKWILKAHTTKVIHIDINKYL